MARGSGGGGSKKDKNSSSKSEATTNDGSSARSALPLYAVRKLDAAAIAALPTGLKRFSLDGERTVEEQLDALTEEQRTAFGELKAKWANKERKILFSDELVLRFIRCSPGEKKFNVKTAYATMKNYAPWSLKHGYHSMTVDDVEEQLRTKTLMVTPGLRSRDGHEFFYMKPGRFFPGKTPTDELLKCLVYLLSYMSEREQNCSEGIAFMVNMENWSYSNFSVSYCRQFFETMQGRFPTRIRCFLIINPPSWFGAIWRIIKSIVTKDFADKVHMPTFEQMLPFLHPENSIDDLPDEFGGKLEMDQVVDDFIDYRRRVEGIEGSSAKLSSDN